MVKISFFSLLDHCYNNECTFVEFKPKMGNKPCRERPIKFQSENKNIDSVDKPFWDAPDAV